MVHRAAGFARRADALTGVRAVDGARLAVKMRSTLAVAGVPEPVAGIVASESSRVVKSIESVVARVFALTSATALVVLPDVSGLAAALRR